MKKITTEVISAIEEQIGKHLVDYQQEIDTRRGQRLDTNKYFFCRK